MGISKILTESEYFVQTVIGLKYTYNNKELLKLLLSSTSVSALLEPE